MFRSALENLMTRSTLRALRHRYFAIEEIAGFFSGAGVWVYRVGLQVFTWELTHSGVWLGIIALSEAAPGIFIAPIAGTLADRYDRLVLAKVVQFAIMIVTAVLAAFTLMGLVDIWVLLGFALLHGMAAGFWQPIRLAMVPNLVPREDLSAGIALHSALFNLSRFIGPASAAPILAIWGTGAAFAFNAITYLIFLVGLFFIKLVNIDQKAQAGQTMLFYLKQGFFYITSHPALKFLFLNAIFAAMFMRAYMELLPGLSETMFNFDAKEGVAFLISAMGLGALFGSLLIGNFTTIKLMLRCYFVCAISGLCFVTLFLSTGAFWFGAVCVIFLSISTVGMNIAGQFMVQSTVRGELRGRVMSFWGLINRSGPALGALLLGWIAGYWGFRWPMLSAVVVTTMVCCYVISKRAQIEKELTEVQ